MFVFVHIHSYNAADNGDLNTVNKLLKEGKEYADLKNPDVNMLIRKINTGTASSEDFETMEVETATL